ncbi:MAG: DNA repair protein RecO [Dehalococcoidia bacterium]|nr:DNA repair protein RecO [Dehalococcoidia bacterium]
MARPRVYKTEVVVVRQSPMGEADRIVTLLSPERGQIRAVAKGVRRAGGRLTGHLELLNRVQVSLAEGRNLDIVVEAQCLDGFPALRSDLGKVAAGMYLAEIADAFSVPQENDHRDSDARKVYELVAEALGRLEAGVECGLGLAQRDHAYSAAAGGIVCPDCITGAPGPFLPVSVNAIKALRYYMSQGLAGAAALKVPYAVRKDAGRILDTHLRYHLDREPRSAGFLQSIGRDQAGP